ncbi:MAG: hypothetical protein KAY22_27560 [Rhizorhabdus sp.]|uniref:hypothetical protein n=1 Tax=Rhizorhabdus sp. TaxID=1968843 RepID=UPI001B460BB4|nr:hypothetical protein [Rhizorhabdus sp.]MBP8236049.1 hypothetical protein [Rhizorhabdus sp.]
MKNVYERIVEKNEKAIRLKRAFLHDIRAGAVEPGPEVAKEDAIRGLLEDIATHEELITLMRGRYA